MSQITERISAASAEPSSDGTGRQRRAPKFGAILFDLGDTLLDFGPIDAHAVFRVAARGVYQRLQESGCTLPPLDRYCNAHFRAMRWAYFRAKLRRREFNSMTVLRRVARRMRLPADEKLLRELAWHWYEPVTAHSSAESDLLPTLNAFRDAGLKLGLVSNTFIAGTVLDRHLDRIGLLEFLPVRIYSSEVGYRKPHRRIFQLALGQIGMEAVRTLFVGDLVKADIVGARRMGMKTALKQPRAVDGKHRIADYVIRRISDLNPIVLHTS